MEDFCEEKKKEEQDNTNRALLFIMRSGGGVSFKKKFSPFKYQKFKKFKRRGMNMFLIMIQLTQYVQF